MKYLKFTHVDSVTGISVASEPARSGPVFPAVVELVFVWARESAYPTNVPELFGTCPDGSATQLDGVLGVFVQSDWEQMQRDEMRARVPKFVTMNQARKALRAAGYTAAIESAINAMPSPQKEYARDEWEYSQEVQRGNGLVASMAPALGLSEEQIDGLFIAAARM